MAITLEEFAKTIAKAGDNYDKQRGTSYIPSKSNISPNRVRKSMADLEGENKEFKAYLPKFERVRAKTQRRPITEWKPKKRNKSVVEEKIVEVLHDYDWEYTPKDDQEPIDKRCWRMLRYLEKVELAFHQDSHLPAIFRIDADITRMRQVMLELKDNYLAYDFAKFKQTLKEQLHLSIEDASVDFKTMQDKIREILKSEEQTLQKCNSVN